MTTKDRDNLAGYRKSKISGRKILVCEELEKLAKNKVKFEKITHLAKTVADMVTQRELSEYANGNSAKKRTPPMRSGTLQREGSPYLSLLTSYLEGKPISLGKACEIRPEDIKAIIKKYPVLKAFIAQKELEISNLKTNLSTMENARSKTSSQLPATSTVGIAVDIQRMKDNLDMTVTALFRLVESLDFLEINIESRTIIDLSKSFGNKDAVDRTLLRPFFDGLADVGLGPKGGK